MGAFKSDMLDSIIYKHIIPYFPQYFCGFSGILEDCKAVVTGSTILHAILEKYQPEKAKSWSPGDLDVVVPEEYQEKLCTFILGRGYTLQTMHMVKGSNWFLKSFYHDISEKKIDVMVLRKGYSYKDYIGGFDLSCVQNYFDGTDVYAAHLSYTMLMLAILNEKNSTFAGTYYAGNKREPRKERLEKYNKRGFTLVNDRNETLYVKVFGVTEPENVEKREQKLEEKEEETQNATTETSTQTDTVYKIVEEKEEEEEEDVEEVEEDDGKTSYHRYLQNLHCIYKSTLQDIITEFNSSIKNAKTGGLFFTIESREIFQSSTLVNKLQEDFLSAIDWPKDTVVFTRKENYGWGQYSYELEVKVDIEKCAQDVDISEFEDLVLV